MNTFDERVRRTIEQLQHESLRAIASDITQKRMAWLDRTLPEKPGYDQFTPREAYEMLFFELLQSRRYTRHGDGHRTGDVFHAYNSPIHFEKMYGLQIDSWRMCGGESEG